LRQHLAFVARLLAHVHYPVPGNPDGKHRFAAILAEHLSRLRLRRLLNSKTRADLAANLVRTLHLSEGRANLMDLAEGIFSWGERTRRKWAFDYYDNLPKELEKA